MSEHVGGTHRDQTILFPDTLDKYVDAENPVRFIEAFIDSLNLEKLGFKHSMSFDVGNPSYDPSDLLKLGMLIVGECAEKRDGSRSRVLQKVKTTANLLKESR